MSPRKPSKCPNSQPCGKWCISLKDNCLSKLSPKAQQYASDLILQLTGQPPRGKGGGAGSASLTEQEVEELAKNQSFLESSSPVEIINAATRKGLKELADTDYYDPAEDDLEAIADAIYNNLPDNVKLSLLNKGSLPPTEYYNPETGQHGPPNEERSRFLVKRYIEQNGRDLYTGLPLPSIIEADLEHIEGVNTRAAKGQKADEPDNIGFTTKSVNQRKRELPMKEFFKQKVAKEQKKAAKDPNYWANKQQSAAQRQNQVNSLKQLASIRPRDQWDDAEIDRYAKEKKYYYATNALLDENQTDPTRARRNNYTKGGAKGRANTTRGAQLPVGIGLPLTKELAKAHREKDQKKIEELERDFQTLLTKASQESSAKGGGNAEAKPKNQSKDTLMLNEWDNIRKKYNL